MVFSSLGYFYPRSPCGERQLYESRSNVWQNFYPRSPCGERPTARGSYSIRPEIFLSTLSLRRATNQVVVSLALGTDIISIHALLAESDDTVSTQLSALMRLFLSTLSLRRATGEGFARSITSTDISIHALLAESDRCQGTCGTRHSVRIFLSTLSLRRATLRKILLLH